MRHMRGVGAVGVVAAVVLACGCSGGERPGPAAASSSAAASPVVAPVEETVDPYPDTPEGDFDRMVDGKGWAYDDTTYGSASEYVADICVSMTDQQGFGTEPGEWLALRTEGDDAEILRAGMPKLCPKWSKTALAALDGNFVRTYTDGTYEVKAKPAPEDLDSDVQEMKAGTYRTKGDLDGCYWERSSQSGDIIANQLATAARQITVTVRVGELFTSRDCGTWKPL